MDLNLTVSGVHINPNNGRYIDVEVNGVDSDDILNQINIDKAIKYYSTEGLLDMIGIDRVKEYFDLTEVLEDESHENL